MSLKNSTTAYFPIQTVKSCYHVIVESGRLSKTIEIAVVREENAFENSSSQADYKRSHRSTVKSLSQRIEYNRE